MPKEELKSKLPAVVDNKLYLLVLQQMTKSESVALEEDIVRLAGHQVALAGDQRALRENLLAVYQREGLTPPYFKELCAQLGASPAEAMQVLSLLIDEGLIVKIKEELYCHCEPLERLKRQLVDYLTRNGMSLWN